MNTDRDHHNTSRSLSLFIGVYPWPIPTHRHVSRARFLQPPISPPISWGLVDPLMGFDPTTDLMPDVIQVTGRELVPVLVNISEVHG